MNNHVKSDDVTTFFSFIDQKIQQLDNEITNGHDPSILLLSLLDTLSLFAYPNEYDNKKRFIKLIDNYSDWQDKNRISLIQLQHLLKRIKISSLKYDELCKKVNSRIDQWENGRVYRAADVDLSITELNKYRDGQTDCLIDVTRYPVLLWLLRNWLVHSFIKPGFGMDVSSDKTTPYYHGMYHSIEAMNNNDKSQKTWELVISPQLVLNLIKSSAQNLQIYFRKNSINPYDRSPFAECWFSDRDVKSLANRVKRVSWFSKVIAQIKRWFSSTK